LHLNGRPQQRRAPTVGAFLFIVHLADRIVYTGSHGQFLSRLLQMLYMGNKRTLQDVQIRRRMA
jgi:hypothetical protein